MPEPLDARGGATGKISIRESRWKPLQPPLVTATNTTAVPNPVLGQMLLSAFRYALGRSTYITHDTVIWMRTYWPQLRPWHKQIHGRIREAIESGQAGMKCDVYEWRKILELPVA